MELLRILLIHNRYRWSGGEETTVERLHAALENAGQDVCRLEVTNPHSTATSLKSLALAPWNHIARRRISSAIEESSPHVVHVHNTWFSLSPTVFRASTAHQIPTVTTIQNYRLVCPEAHLYRDGHPCTACVGGFPFPGIKYRCYRDSAILSAISGFTTMLHKELGSWQSIDRVHVPARFAREILEAGPFDASKFVVFPNAVPDPGGRKVRPSQSSRVLFVGRLSHEKGLDRILHAWQRSRARGLTLTIAGEGPAMKEWRMLAPGDVEFLGRLGSDEVKNLMLKARALVFPSRWFEVCPMVIVEGLAAGLPVIGHDLGAITELIDFGAPNTLVHPDDDRGWDRALAEIANDKLVDELGAKARAAYERRHTIPSWVDAHVKMYREAGA